MIVPRLLLVAPSLLALAACGSGGGGTGGMGTGGTTTTSSATSVCSTDPRVVPYAAGVSQAAMDGKVKVTFADAVPSPPAKGTNTFTVDVADDTAKPISGAAITVKPFMPDHGHGASVTPTVTEGSEAGRYIVEDVELFMPGVWEITFTVTPAGGAADPVKLTFCIDG